MKIKRRRRLLGLGRSALLGKKHGLNVGQHATLGDGDVGQKTVQLLIVADGQLQVARVDASLLVVAGSVASQLKNLSGQVLHNGGEVYGGTSTDTLGVVSISEKTMNTTNGKLETSPRGTRLCLRFGLATFATARHDES